MTTDIVQSENVHNESALNPEPNGTHIESEKDTFSKNEEPTLSNGNTLVPEDHVSHAKVSSRLKKTANGVTTSRLGHKTSLSSATNTKSDPIATSTVRSTQRPGVKGSRATQSKPKETTPKAVDSQNPNNVKLVRFPWKKNIQPRVQTSNFGPKQFRKEMIKENKAKKADFSGQDITQINVDEYFMYEYLYFRDMEIKTLDLLSIFPNLRVLDLSSNEIDNLDFLQNMPALRHLSISSNALTSFETLPAELVELESLSIGNNKIESFTGMPAFEHLRVLSVQSNFIENFNGFPILYSLDTIDLRDNPIVLNVGSTQLRDIVIALHKFAPLKRVNGASIVELVSTEDKANIFAKYDGKIAYCIREGYLPPALLPGVQISSAEENEAIKSIRSQAAAHLIQNQKLKTEGTPFELYHINLGERPLEGCSTSISIIFKVKEPEVVIQSDEFAKHTFTSSDNSHEYVVINGYHIPMDKGLDDALTATVLLPTGDYQFGFTNNARETPESLSDLSLQEPCTSKEDEDIDYFILLQWFKLNNNGLFEEIPNANSLSIVPLVSDIDSHLKAQLFCFDAESNIVFSVFDISDSVQQSKPQCNLLTIQGECVQGRVLTAESSYFGGVEGNSIYKWFGPNDHVVEGREYKLSLDDVESTIRLQYTPIRSDGVAGDSVTVESAVIEPSCPEIVDLVIHGNVQEGENISVTYSYQGGYQGTCAIQWMRQNGETGEYEIIPGETNSEYSLVLADVNHKVMVRVTPVSDKGVTGPDSVLETEVVAPAHPRLLSLEITALKLEEDKIIVTEPVYYGGYEGRSQVQWYRVSADAENQERVLIEEASDQHMYKCTFDDVGHLIEVAYTPCRDDGVVGETVHQLTDGIVRSGPPKCTAIHINGEPIENATLNVSVEYKGGTEGSSIYRWYRVPKDSVKDKEDEEVDSSAENDQLDGELLGKGEEYKITLQDIGYRIRVDYIPVREDGVEGELVSAYTEVVTALPPQILNIRVSGKFEEFEKIQGDSDYSGGFEKEKRHRWIKIVESEEFPEGERIILDFATENTYFIDSSDVNTRLIYACQAVSTEDVESEWVETEPSSIITPQQPVISIIRLNGNPQEDQTLELEVQGDNFEREASQIEWYRTRDSLEEHIQTGGWTYNPTLADTHSKILCKVIPVRPQFNLFGDAVTVQSEIVLPAGPSISNIEILGSAVEDRSLSVSYTYYGGHEGTSRIQWFRVNESSEVEVEECFNSKEFKVSTTDLNCNIRCKITPVRDDGVEGVTQIVDSGIVIGSPPTVTDLKIHGEPIEDKSLNITYTYYGGIEGSTKKEWYRLTSPENEDGKISVASGTESYAIQLEDIDNYIQFVCTPVRDDGEEGSTVTVTSLKVQANPPVVSNVQIIGDGYVGSNLQATGTYTGGFEGESIIEWQSSENRTGPWTTIQQSSSNVYFPTPDQLNMFVKAIYHPVRKDGVTGTPIESQLVKIHVGSTHFQPLIEMVHQAQCKLTQCEPSIHFAPKQITASKGDSIVFKSPYDSLIIEVDSTNETNFTLKRGDNSITIQAADRKDRDFAVLACRLFYGLSQATLTNAVFGTSFATAWKKKKNIPAALESAQSQVVASEKPTDQNLANIYEVMKAVLSQDM